MPADAPFLLYVEDTPRLIERWSGSSLASLWSDPEIARFFAPLREDLKVDHWNEEALEETGYEIKDLISFFSGQTLFMVPTLSIDSDTENLEAAELPALFIADLGDRAGEFEELLLRQEDKADNEVESDTETLREVREFRGENLHIEQLSTSEGTVDGSTWVIFDGRLVLSTVPSLVERFVVTAQGDSKNEPITGNTDFQTALTAMTDSDIMAFANLAIVIPELKKQLTEEVDSSEPQLVTPDAVFDAFGLDLLDAAFSAIQLGLSGVKMTTGLLASENRGLMALLAYGPGSAPSPGSSPDRPLDSAPAISTSRQRGQLSRA